ncbi:MAG TPA: cytochrome c oxidase assembly protein [Actinomycetota bacterium]|nr:cytochrome c oxidase assembly protein [Actinomycetota bacterium]
MPALAHGTAGAAFEFHPHPDVWLLIAVLLGGYFAALKYLGPKRVPPGREIVTSRQRNLYLLGVGLLWIGADWPVHDLSEGYLFSVHMVQHTIFTFIAPPLMLMGVPQWLLRTLLAPPRLYAAVRWLTRPLIAFAIFNVLVAVTHWGAVVDASVRSGPVHLGVHTLLVTSAFLMWWPVVAPLPEMSRLSVPGKMLYLFGQSILPTVPASFLTFATEPIYRAYEEFPRLWGIGVVTDQRVAGLIMKVGGGLLLWTIIAVMFFRWSSAQENREVEEITWDDFERELEAWELRK